MALSDPDLQTNWMSAELVGGVGPVPSQPVCTAYQLYQVSDSQAALILVDHVDQVPCHQLGPE